MAQDEKKEVKELAEKSGAEDKDAEETGENVSESQGGEEDGLHPPKKFSKKMLIIAAVVGVLILGGGTVAGLYFSGIIGGKTTHKETTEGHGEKATSAEHASGHETTTEEENGNEDEHIAPTFFPLGDILVNLSGDGKRPNFLKITITLELADAKDIPALESLKPRIVDQFQVYLRELRVEDLRGSAGLYRLREELLLRVTEVIQPIRVRDVLFQELLVQ